MLTSSGPLVLKRAMISRICSSAPVHRQNTAAQPAWPYGGWRKRPFRLPGEPRLPLIQLPAGTFQRRLELGRVDGLQQEVRNAIAQGLTREFEIVMARQDNEMHLRMGFPDTADKFQSIHFRHANIGDDDVGPAILQHLERFNPVLSFAGDDNVKTRPLNKLSQTQMNGVFVIYQHDPVHGVPPR